MEFKENDNKKEEKSDEIMQNKFSKLDISKYKIIPIKKDENEDSDRDEEEIKEITFKIVIIGDQGVGKSSIIKSLVNENEEFKNYYKATLGFDIFHYKAKVNDIIIKLQIWDTCGLKEFSSCTPNLYKNASLAILVYDINNKDAFDNAENWLNLLKLHSKPGILAFIVGNKRDLENERQVLTEQGEKFMEEHDFNFFIETSAKERLFIKELFYQAFAQLYEYYQKERKNCEDDEEEEEEEERIDFSKRKGTMKLGEKPKKKNQNNSGCCNIY
jgi:small GTP-binding protein